MRHFDYGEQDYIPCEFCYTRVVDIHHINGRGKGKDVIGNLIALCRDCHDKCYKELITKDEAQEKHNFILKHNGNN
jgi:predicted restriction endonuclease